MRTIRKTIPLDEILANMKNEPKATQSTRYSRIPTYVNEAEAEARKAIVGLVVCSIAALALLMSIFSVTYAMGRIQAQDAAILAKSELHQAKR